MKLFDIPNTSWTDTLKRQDEPAVLKPPILHAAKSQCDFRSLSIEQCMCFFNNIWAVNLSLFYQMTLACLPETWIPRLKQQVPIQDGINEPEQLPCFSGPAYTVQNNLEK